MTDVTSGPAIGRRTTGRVAGHAALLACSVFALGPIVWMYLTALRPRDQVLSQSLFAGPPSLDNVRQAAQDLPVVTLALHTTAMSAGVALGQLLTGLLAAYAFGRWRFRGDRLLFLVFVATWLVPFQVTMIPNYVMLSNLGWLGTLTGVIVPQLCSAFSVLLLRQHIRSFPRELFDAARMDGRSSFSTLWTVLVPNLRAPLAALGILLFVTAWNEYFWPLLVLSEPDSVVQIGLQSFLTDTGVDYGAMMAAAGLLSLPIFALYVVLQRQVVGAFVRSGLR